MTNAVDKSPKPSKLFQRETTASQVLRKPLERELVAEKGKGDQFYLVHPYHTKVPVSILKDLIKYYTEPGEVVLDPFCGSGSTGLASILTGRHFLISDLSPYAAHIARGHTEYCAPAQIIDAQKVVLASLTRVRKEYLVTCHTCGRRVEASYWIWSDEFTCPFCQVHWILNPKSRDEGASSYGTVKCPKCGKTVPVSAAREAFSEPVSVAYKCVACGTTQREVELSKAERRKLLKRCAELPSNPKYNLPMMNMPFGGAWGEQYRTGNHKFANTVSSFFTKRNFYALCKLWDAILQVDDTRARVALQFAFTAGLFTSSRMVRCRPQRDGRSNIPGTLYLPPLFLEQNPFKVWERRVDKVIKLKSQIIAASQQMRFGRVKMTQNDFRNIRVADTRCLTHILSESVDFIVTDPPFGDSLQYAELNFIPEAFLGQFTDTRSEIVVNPTRKVTEEDYIELMKKSLAEMYRVLKRGHFLCLLFNNTSPLLWLGIKKGVIEAGFRIVAVTGIVKGHGSWNQTVHPEFTSRFDPVIHAIKPTKETTRPVLCCDLPGDESDRLALFLATNLLKGMEKEQVPKYQRSLPYIHSHVVRLMLAHEAICEPPSPKKLLGLLNDHVKVSKGPVGEIFLSLQR